MWYKCSLKRILAPGSIYLEVKFIKFTIIFLRECFCSNSQLHLISWGFYMAGQDRLLNKSGLYHALNT